MTTPAQLREALDRAASQLHLDLDAAETRVRARAAVRRRRRRLATIATAAIATVGCVALVFLVGLGTSSAPRKGTTTALVPGPVSRGIYLLPGFPGNASLRLSSGWTVDRATAGDVRLSRHGYAGAELGFAVRPRVFRPAAANLVTLAPQDPVGWIKGHRDLVLVSSSPVRSGKYLGTSMELQVSARPRTTGGGCAGQCLPLFQLAAGPVDVPASALLHVVAINEAGRFVVAYSWADAASYPAWSRLADRVIATLGTSGP